ncbi:nitrilase family protein [Flavobacterium amnicola]|uniref:Omega-amidase YafV n=1 Tax=Flavobacterium amnicola TaxID=2506422 RepID=A0A4Q1K5B0_9FLAO|nr:nitrilase family protein [Flavobacterium amnicola]RXR20787.1 nitrilase family protein [Flavobacterium amnicola]
MKVVILQSDIIWENPQANRIRFEQKIKTIQEEVELIVLPEMFSTGFTMHPFEVAETMQGQTVAWMKQMAQLKKSAVTGSVIITENGNFYNRMVFVFPNGAIQSYDKRHLFSLAKEEAIFTPGKEKVIVDYNGWKICLQICYDLRFPVFARNVENYDVLLYVASWPKPRINAWDTLLQARAIENMCYVVGVNRIGIDGNNYEYIGHSQAVDFLGNYLVAPFEEETFKIITLDKNQMLETRSKLNFLKDRDTFEIFK